MTISVTIDSCAWNFFFDNEYDLCVELPSERFSLFITREVELELDQIPDESQVVDKRLLKEYIRKSIERRQVELTCVFGFSGDKPEYPPRYGGFDHGTFEQPIEHEWRQREETKRFVRDSKTAKPRGKNKLRKNEADASLAVASLTSVLITADQKKTKDNPRDKGPIHDASINGGRVLYLLDFESSSLTLADYIEKHFPMIEAL